MIGARIACDLADGFAEDPCPVLKLYDADHAYTPLPLEELPSLIRERLTEAGWTVVGDLHRCPRHSVEKVGYRVTLGGEYKTVGEGVQARVPGGQELIVEIEVRRTP